MEQCLGIGHSHFRFRFFKGWVRKLGSCMIGSFKGVLCDISPIIEKHMENNMENEMEAGIMMGNVGVTVFLCI